MRRSFQVIVWILIGALACGVGVSWVLYRANRDRERLSQELQTTGAKLTSLQQQLTQITQESNQKVEAAAQELARIQSQLHTQGQLQNALKTATPLYPPPFSQTRQWSEIASVPMGVSIRVPPGMQAKASDDGLFISARGYLRGTPTEEQWLVLTPYRPDREEGIRSRMYQPQEVSYSLAGRLLSGTRSPFMDGKHSLFLLAIHDHTSTTHLLWAKTLDGLSERTLLDILGTLSFR